jgi:hypothetical protein
MEKKMPSEENATSKEKLWDTTKNTIPVVVSIIGGILVFLFWFAGRVYAVGYFSALGIANYMVSFQTWEYIEQSWFPLVTLFFLNILLVHILDKLAKMLVNNVAKLIAKINLGRAKKTRHKNEQLSGWTKKTIIIFGNILIILVFIRVDLLCIYTLGWAFGNRYVFTASPRVELIADMPLLLGPYSGKSGYDNQYFYHYGGLHLLTYNEGHYYFFKEIDPVTCLPKKVYIIDDAHFVPLVSSQPDTLGPQECISQIDYLLGVFPFPVYIPSQIIGSP